MSLLLRSSFAIASVFLLVACSSSEPRGLIRETTLTLEGTLTSRPLQFGDVGTHVLTAETGETAVLRSTLVNLGNFTGSTVRVIGTQEEGDILHVVSLLELEGEPSLASGDVDTRGILEWGDFRSRIPAGWNADGEGCLMRESGARMCVQEADGSEQAFQAEKTFRVLGTLGWKQVRENGDVYIGVKDRPSRGDMRVFSLVVAEDPLRETYEFYEILLNMHLREGSSDDQDASDSDTAIESQEQVLAGEGVAPCDAEGLICPESFSCKKVGFEELDPSYCTDDQGNLIDPVISEVPAEDSSEEGESSEEAQEVVEPEEPPVSVLVEYTLDRIDYYFSLPDAWYFQQLGDEVQAGPTDFTLPEATVRVMIRVSDEPVAQQQSTLEEGIITIRQPRGESGSFLVIGAEADRATLFSIAESLRDKE